MGGSEGEEGEPGAGPASTTVVVKLDMASPWVPVLSPSMAPPWVPLSFWGVPDVGTGGVPDVGTGVVLTWVLGFLSLSSSHFVAPCLRRYGFGSNGVPFHFRKSLGGGSNKPSGLALLVKPFSVSLQWGDFPLPSTPRHPGVCSLINP
jgi:hypothetical protein